MCELPRELPNDLKLQIVILENCKISAVKHFKELPILLSPVILSAIFFPLHPVLSSLHFRTKVQYQQKPFFQYIKNEANKPLKAVNYHRSQTSYYIFFFHSFALFSNKISLSSVIYEV